MAADTEEFNVALNPAQQAGGQREVGEETLIGWEPSDTAVAVKVTVMFHGTTIAVKTLSPTNLLMTYKGTSGEDYTKGTLKAKFNSGGKSGQIDTQGLLTWSVSGSEGSWSGFVGEWKVS